MCGSGTGELVEEGLPLVAVLSPTADLVNAGEGCGRHAVAEAGLVGYTLHAVDETVEITDGEDEAFDVVGEEILGASGGGGDDGASAGKSLSLNEREAFFDAGQDHDVAGAHVGG